MLEEGLYCSCFPNPLAEEDENNFSNGAGSEVDGSRDQQSLAQIVLENLSVK